MPKPAKAAKRPSAAGPQPLGSARTHCPITKELIRIVKAGDMWMASTSLWTSRPFHSRDRLLYELSYEAGLAPAFPEPGVRVVRDANEPPGPREPVGVTPEEQDVFK